MRQTFEQMFATRDWLLADGATGTNLFHVGLETGYPPELWNVEYPDRATTLHASFIAAGADIILTNSDRFLSKTDRSLICLKKRIFFARPGMIR